MKAFLSVFLIASLSVLGSLAGQATSHTPVSIAAAAGLSDGEIRKVDKDAKKLTIRHGPLENLNMPPMTMVFQVKEQAMLDAVKTGDKVRFSAEKVGGAYTVTHLEVVNR